MSWLELSVRVARQHASLVESLLKNEPVLAVTLTDDADNPVLEPGVGETPLWPSVCVTALFDEHIALEPLARMLSLVPGIDRPQHVNFRTLDDQQWERSWMERFKPMQFGRRLWIVPGEMDVPRDAVHVIRLDPGLAFGTGTHPTTRLCLQWMDGHVFNDRVVMDYGCGSGVLGIAAAIKGARKVVCIDNDPQALSATLDNAVRNAVADRVEVLAPEQLGPLQADVVVANILAAPLIELAPVLLSCLSPGGFLVLSGILVEQTDEVKTAYLRHTDDIVTRDEQGWVRLCCHKPLLSTAEQVR